jgi:anti-anti-sigma regulatory factor
MMEVARKSQPQIPQPPPPEAAPPKLAIEKFADAGVTLLKFTGTIDEAFDGKKVARSAEGHTLVLDLGGVKKISSFGIREWVDFVGAAKKTAVELLLIECAPKVVDQLNMVANFTAGGRVFSFYAPFRCDYCDSEHRVLLDLAKDHEAIRSMKLADRPCPSCKESMYFDEDGSTYFSYVLGQGQFELDPVVVQFLAAKLDYRVGTVDAKLRVDKLIEGRATYLRLTGDLDNTFPRDKLAEGLEGTVVVDVTGVARVEPAGAAEWRGFVSQVAPLVEQMYLIGVAPTFLERLCGRDDLGAKCQVADFTLPYACGTCGTTTAQLIDVTEHHAVIKFATAPELHCPQCKSVMQCTASEAAMTLLPVLPLPEIPKNLARTIAELRARKIEKRSTTGLVAVPKSDEPRRSAAVPILLGILVAAVLAAGALYYVRSNHTVDPGPYGLGPVAASSAAARPAWIRAELAPGSASCIGAGARITCSGASSLLASQEEAEDEAGDAALESLAAEAGRSIRDPAWNTAIQVQLVPARDAALAAYSRDPQSTQARRAVHDGRRAVAHALARGNGPQIGARYWEAFDTSEGRRYIAFASVDVPVAQLRGAAEGYAQAASALGATVVSFFPELGWRFPKLEHGAVVTKLEHGPLQDLGLAEHYIVLAIDGRDVIDAASFAKIANEEHAQLVEHGGLLRLLVQTDTGDPREFSRTIPGKLDPAAPRVRDVRPRGDVPPTGGINVWDRFGGNRGSGRDDPAQ